MLCTLERHQCILELKNKQVCHDLQVDFPLPLVILSYWSILNCSKLVWSISTLFCSSSMSFFKTGICSTWFLMGVNKFGILSDVFVSTFWITTWMHLSCFWYQQAWLPSVLWHHLVWVLYPSMNKWEGIDYHWWWCVVGFHYLLGFLVF